MSYEDGKTDEKTVDVLRGERAHVEFIYNPNAQALAVVPASLLPAIPSPVPQFTDPVINPIAGWHTTNNSDGATARYNIHTEVIEGRERDVLEIEIRHAINNRGWAKARISNPFVLNKLREASRLRFRVLGDGARWEIFFGNRPATGARETYHFTSIATRKNRVVEINIPYSRFGMDDRIRFNKDLISALHFIRHRDYRTGTSTIKIFDFDIIP
jgi:hypothetical protein